MNDVNLILRPVLLCVTARMSILEIGSLTNDLNILEDEDIMLWSSQTSMIKDNNWGHAGMFNLFPA